MTNQKTTAEVATKVRFEPLLEKMKLDQALALRWMWNLPREDNGDKNPNENIIKKSLNRIIKKKKNRRRTT